MYILTKSYFKAFLEQFRGFISKHKRGVKYGYRKSNMKVLFLAYKLMNINNYVKGSSKINKNVVKCNV